MGDFNLPKRQIGTWLKKATEHLKAKLYPNMPTRGNAMLDFIIIPAILEKKLAVSTPIGNSDHNSLLATVNLKRRVKRTQITI